jgi:hypothetical protein
MTRKLAAVVAGDAQLQRALARWGAEIPDWVAALARAADSEIAKGGNLETLGKMLGILGRQISGILGKTFPGKLDRFEKIVRGKLMRDTVQCPVLHMEIGSDACADYQRRKFSSANPQLARLAKGCPACPHAIGGKK